MTEAKWALDRSQLDRQLLGDLAALIAVYQFFERVMPPDAGAPQKVAAIQREIVALGNELWPTG